MFSDALVYTKGALKTNMNSLRLSQPLEEGKPFRLGLDIFEPTMIFVGFAKGKADS